MSKSGLPLSGDEQQLLREFRASVPPADDDTRRRIYAYATGDASRSSARHRIWRTTRHSIVPSSFRLRLALSGMVVVCAAVAAVIVPSVIGRSHGSTSPSRTAPKQSGVSRGLPSFLPLTANFTRSGQTVTSIALSVKASIADAALQLQVVHSDASDPQEATNDPTGGQIVFQQQMQMTNTGSTAADAPLSEWSGTLSPNDWTGGCASGLYAIKAVVVPSGSSYDNPPQGSGSSNAETAWFACTGS